MISVPIQGLATVLINKRLGKRFRKIDGEMKYIRSKSICHRISKICIKLQFEFYLYI
jgi:hypothetical protein